MQVGGKLSSVKAVQPPLARCPKPFNNRVSTALNRGKTGVLLLLSIYLAFMVIRITLRFSYKFQFVNYHP